MVTLFIGICFFLSGAAGLAYENVWLKQVGLACGNTVTATTVVLTAFMFGLALGSAAAGRFADRVRRPLRAYGWLELAIAVSAFAFPWCLARVRELLPPGLQLGAVVLLLAVPTALMGATLPLLVRFAGRGSTGRALGLLYAVNSAGAVAGSLLSGFFLIRTIGLFATTFLAQVTNLAIGVAALVVDGFAGTDDVPEPAAPQPAEAPGAAWVLPCVFASGFAAMLYEVALMKLLPLVLGSSVYSFALMTAAFITGIALGAAAAGLAAPWIPDRVSALAGVQLGMGLSFLGLLPLVNYLPVVYGWLRAGATSFAAFELVSLLLCFAVMLLPTLALGAVLPLAAEALAGGERGATVGRLYGVNTLGNILGTLVTGLVLVPRVGFKGAMEIGVLLNLAAGVALVLAAGRRGTLVTCALGLASGAVSLYVLAYPAVDYLALSAGVFRHGEAPGGRDRLNANRKLVFAREDPAGFVTVEDLAGPPLTRSLRVNGKVDASNGADMITQRLLAHLPLLAHPAPRRVYVIGLGSGVTAGAALTHPVEHVDVVELSPAVAEAARLFAAENHGALDDPRLALAVDDGRIHLERAGLYDVIVSEPSNPWMVGITNLFSRECFALMRDHLAAGGVVSQWLHTYELDPETFRLVVRTFGKVFPHVRAYTSLRADVVLLGAMEPFADDFGALARRMATPAVRRDLADVGVTSPLHLMLHYLAGGRELAAFIGPGDVNSDDWPILEYAAPLALFAKRDTPLPDWEERARAPGSALRRFVEACRPGPADLRDLAEHAAREIGPEVAVQLLRDALAGDPGDVAARRKLAEQLAGLHEREAALGEIEEAARRAPRDPGVLRQRAALAYEVDAAGLSLVRPRTFARALEAARACAAVAPDEPGVRASLAGVLYDRGDWAEAEAEYRAALARDPAPAYHLCLARCRLEQGDAAGARAALQEAAAAPVPEALRELVRRLLAELELARDKEGTR